VQHLESDLILSVETEGLTCRGIILQISRTPRGSFTNSTPSPTNTVAAQSDVPDLIWKYYRALKAYRHRPTKRSEAVLLARFDGIFTLKTGFVTLDRLLKRLHKKKTELLIVLDRPEIPLQTNGSENDIRAQVTRRKISGATRSDVGRDCRDGFIGLAKTCFKLGIGFWDYLGTRLNVPGGQLIPPLAELVLAKARSP
jgi:Transposase IS66 family